MLRVMVWAPKVPPGPHPLVDMDSSLTFASPVITRYPLMLQLGGLEQCEQSFLLKETPTIPEWPHTHARTHTHLVNWLG